MIPNWLPAIIELEQFSGNFEKYLEAIYQRFKRDFVRSRPEFKDLRVGIKRYPAIRGKEATFWHLISEGTSESERIPDLRRCERIGWPKSMIERFEESEVKCWFNVRRGNERRWVIWVESAEYLVVLAERAGYFILWTAYQVTREHQKQKQRREYEEFLTKYG